MDNAPLWNGRKIAKDEDKHDLEQRAAVYEFKHRMARPDAEHRAHHEYKQDKHREAAAYHMQGLKAAQAAGSHEEGHKHGMMYQLHMKELGLDPMGPVPHEIQGLADKQENFYRFKPHRGDAFLLQDKGEDVKKAELEKGDVIKFPGNPAPAVDQGKPAAVKPLPTQQATHTDCELCTRTANSVFEHAMRNHAPEFAEQSIERLIGKAPKDIFMSKHRFWYRPEERAEAHRMLSVLLHARHAWKKSEDDLNKAVLPMKPNTAPAQVQAKPATVTPIAPKQEARKQLARTKVEGILADAHHAMMSDPGFQEAARQRETEAKKAKLKAGGQLFKPGQTVSHVDQEAIPWKGKVTSAAYREDDIDGPGHYYEVKWWNPKLNQYHEDYLHQDNLKPG